MNANPSDTGPKSEGNIRKSDYSFLGIQAGTYTYSDVYSPLSIQVGAGTCRNICSPLEYRVDLWRDAWHA